MPTSKDLLAAAKKTLDEHGGGMVALEASLKEGQGKLDKLAFAKMTVKTSIPAMMNSLRLLKDELAKLNAGLSDLNKNAPVFKAPADAKVYNQLKADYTKSVKEHMTTAKRFEDHLKAIQVAIK